MQSPFFLDFDATVIFLRRFVPLLALSVALIALAALTACGGESSNGDNGSNGGGTTPVAPAATAPPAVPAATPTPDAGGGSDTTPATGTGTETIFVIARGFEIFELALAAGDTVSVNYSSLGRSSGGITTGGKFAGDEGAGSAAGEVILVVLNPVEEQVLSAEQVETNTVEFQADITGKYQLVFSNPYLLQGLEVTVDYTINP